MKKYLLLNNKKNNENEPLETLTNIILILIFLYCSYIIILFILGKTNIINFSVSILIIFFLLYSLYFNA